MHCPICSQKDTKVIDSRLTGDFNQTVKRRRECEKCGFRFSTLEEIEIFSAKVKKKDGSVEQYDRDKVSKGLLKALKGSKFSKEEIERLINSIEYEISKKVKDGLVSSKDIGEIVLKKLKEIDKLAYLRFVSVYRAFDDVREFEKELRKVKKSS